MHQLTQIKNPFNLCNLWLKKFVLICDNYIIHANGKVLIDRLDNLGIYNPELNKHTHKLRVIKKII